MGDSVEQLTKVFASALTLNDTDVQSSATDLTDVQNAELHQWLTLSSRFPDEISKLNDTLKGRTYLLDNTDHASVVDAMVLGRVVKFVKEWDKDTVVANRHVVRWADLIQNEIGVADSDRIKVNVDLEAPREFKAKPEKKAKKEEPKGDDAATAAAAAAAAAPAGDDASNVDENVKAQQQAKKEKKEKKKKEKKPQPAKEEVSVTPGMIDLRVGWIEKAVKHPDADSLYVSTIHMGDEEGPRTVCSGLVKYIPIEQMQDRKVVCVANLKPANMRGIKSQAMVLCASNEENVEFVNPPEGAKAGDKIFFESYDMEPEKQLNPKKKVWETLQPGFTTNEQFEVVFRKEGDADKKLVNKSGEICKASTMANALVR